MGSDFSYDDLGVYTRVSPGNSLTLDMYEDEQVYLARAGTGSPSAGPAADIVERNVLGEPARIYVACMRVLE